MVRQRFHTYRRAGIDGLTLRIEADGLNARIAALEQVMELIRSLDDAP